MVLRVDGSEVFEIEMGGAKNDAAAIGAEAGRRLLAQLPSGLLP
jgi:porphobilinogen deaminase